MANIDKEFKQLLVDRPLTEEEMFLARWMLENGNSEAALFISQLEKARVVGLCGCGCPTIDFKVEGFPDPAGGVQILAEYRFGTDEDPADIFIFERSGILSGFEVCSYGDGPVRILPQPSELKLI